MTGCVKGWVKREEHIMKSVSAQETEQMGQVCGKKPAGIRKLITTLADGEGDGGLGSILSDL